MSSRLQKIKARKNLRKARMKLKSLYASGRLPSGKQKEASSRNARKASQAWHSMSSRQRKARMPSQPVPSGPRPRWHP